MQELAERLRRERKRRKESQIVTADRFGVGQSSYARWETAENKPESDKWATIAAFIGEGTIDIMRMVEGNVELPTLKAFEDRLAAMERDIDALRAAVASTDRAITVLDHTVGVRLTDGRSAKRPTGRPGRKAKD